EEGDRVGAGAVLARLDDGELAVQLASARASFEVANSAFERAEQLREREVITLPEYERDRAALAAAEGTYRQLQTRIGYATVRSPISGVVVEKHVEAGDVVAPQAQLFRVADVSTLVVRVGVSELDVGHLQPGDRIELALDAFPQTPAGGRIRRVFPSADPATRLVTVEIALDSGNLARPGYLARARLRLDQRADAAIVPSAAVLTSSSGVASVFVVEDGKAYRREVETGLMAQGRVEVVRGIQPGQTVVVAGNHSLRDGASVRSVTNRGEVAEPAPPAGGS
ncbi:MAG TPA: efflux RND transporter periplasmic adaptor subunit, partial [Gemmatimonadota bacterium]|nr:efflux RND transporter periplasmic adaptor subunit [Gemmatimonadota bacterium]